MAFARRNDRRTNRDPSPGYYEESFFEFMTQECQEQLKEILMSPNANDHFGLLINYVQLSVSCSQVCNDLLHIPDKVLPEGDKAGLRALRYIYENRDENQGFILKQFVHVRIHSMPSCWDRYKTTFPGCTEIGNFLAIVGTVIRTKVPKLLKYSKEYKCNKCGRVILVKAPASRYHAFPKDVGKCSNQCVGAKFEPVEGDDTENIWMKDYQEITLQEQSKLTDTIPKCLIVTLEHDLVDSCKPGDDVIVTGNLFVRWKPFRPNEPMEGEFAFLANHVQVNNDQRAAIVVTNETLGTFKTFWNQHKDNPFEGRKIILKSFCPEVFGMYLVKLSLVVVLAGGVSKEKKGSNIRGEPHLLLVGDPGTGKSQLLKYVIQLCPRSVMTTGAGTTTAGLTVAAIKEGGEWVLEAGSLVLANGGVCCIDEFTSIKAHDRVSIHEAMEQQSISVAKAGLVCNLCTKCTIIAACNPKIPKYDHSKTMEENIGISSPLLSRFDLIIILKDIESEAWDEYLCDFLLKNAMKPINSKSTQTSSGLWNTEMLQTYLVLIKDKRPTMTENAYLVLYKYYQLQRSSTQRDKSRTTFRLYEGLVRLAEGHARLMYRDLVLIHDAITAVSLIEATKHCSSLASMVNPMHVPFPEDPVEEYYNQARIILDTLGLSEVWNTEKSYLDNIIANSNKGNPTSEQGSPDIVHETENASFHLTSSFRNVQISTADEDLFPEEISEFFNDCDISEDGSTDVATNSSKRNKP